MTTRHYLHKHSGQETNVNLPYYFGDFDRFQVHHISIVNNIMNITAALGNNSIDLDGAVSIIPDGVYTVDSLNRDAVIGLFAFILSNDGNSYKLFSYPSSSDKVNGTNATEIVGHELTTKLNKQIFDNRMELQRVKLECSVLNIDSNDHDRGVHEDNYILLPIAVGAQGYQFFSYQSPMTYDVPGNPAIKIRLLNMDDEVLTVPELNSIYIMFEFVR